MPEIKVLNFSEQPSRESRIQRYTASDFWDATLQLYALGYPEEHIKHTSSADGAKFSPEIPLEIDGVYTFCGLGIVVVSTNPEVGGWAGVVHSSRNGTFHGISEVLQNIPRPKQNGRDYTYTLAARGALSIGTIGQQVQNEAWERVVNQIDNLVAELGPQRFTNIDVQRGEDPNHTFRMIADPLKSTITIIEVSK